MAKDRVHFSQRILSVLLSSLLATQPILPAIAATMTPSGGTQMDKAGNGVPVVNIATPNTSGISHNKYQDYNVGKEGLILNNATGKLNQTQLGGLIQNNPHLKAGQEAKGIINEVTGTNRSQLQGYTEVAGKAANVIVANPYGITCNGCGFINTPNATLTTGKPVLDANGKLQSLDVTKGSITIEGQGLDGSQSDAVSIIARATEINAALHAKDLNVTAGANRVGADGSVTGLKGEGAAPKVAIDTGALGGMYANRIHLVSGEKGVGVNVGNLNARQGDITLNSAGQLVVKNSLASGNTTVTGSGITLSGEHKAGGNMTAHGQTALTLDNTQLAADKNLQLTTDGKLTQNGGSLTAGVDASLTANRLSQRADAQAGAGRNLTISSTENAELSGKNVAKQDATVNAKTLTTGTQLTAARHLSLSASQRATLNGSVAAGQQLSVNGGALVQNGSVSAADITLNGQTLTQDSNSKTNATGNIALTTTGVATLKGNTVAGKSLSVNSASLDNGATLAAGTKASVKTGTLVNSGTVQGNSLDITGTDITSSGSLKSASSLDMAASNFTLSGETGAKGTTTVTASGKLDNRGQFVTDDGLTLNAGQINNSGTLSGGTGLKATADIYTSTASSVLHSNDALSLAIGDVTLAGETSAGGSISIKANSLKTTPTAQTQGESVNVDVLSAQLGGSQAAAGNMRLSARDTLTHSGKSSAGILDVDSAALSNTGTMTAASLTLTAPELVNNGLIQGQQTLGLTTRRLENQAAGTLATGGILALEDTDVTSSGKIIADGGLVLHNGQLANSGDISGAEISLSGVSLNNLQGGLIYTDGLLNLTGSTPVNAGEIQADTLMLTGARLSNSGTLRTLSSATVRLSDMLLNPGRLLGYGSLTLAAGGLQNSGTLAAKNLSLSLSSLENNGQVQGDQTLVLDVPRLINGPTGKIFSGSDLSLSLSGMENQGILQVDGQLALDGDSFTNAGHLVADALKLSLSGNLNNQASGEVLAGENLTIQSAGLDNSGLILGEGSADVQVATLDSSGTLAADTLTLTADIMGIRGLVQGMSALTLAARNIDTDGAARLLSAGNLSLRVEDTLASSGTLQGHEVTVSAAQWIHNGVLLATDRLSSVVSGLLTLKGELMSQGDSELHSQTLTSTGRLLSEGDMRLDGSALINSGVIQGSSLSTSQATVTNSGTLTGLDGLTLAHDGLILENRASGKILTQGQLTVRGKTLRSQGNWQGEHVLIQGQTLDQSNGTIRALDTLDLTLTGDLTTGDSALIVSEGRAAIKALTLTHQGEWQAKNLLAEGDVLKGSGESRATDQLDIRTGQLVLEDGGALLSGNLLTVNTGTFSNNGRVMGGNVDLSTATLTNSGRIQADSSLTLATDGNVANNVPGVLQSGGVLSVTAPELLNNGLLQSGTDTGLAVSRLFSGGGKILAGGALTLDTPRVLNDGWLQASSLVLNAGELTNTGEMVVAGEATLTGDALTNSGTLQAEALELNQHQQTYSGIVLGRQSTSVNAERAELKADGKLYSGGGLSLVADTLIQAGQIVAVGDITLKLVNAFTSDSTLASRGALSIDSQNAITLNAPLQGERVSLTAGGTFTSNGLLSLGSGGGLISAASLMLNAAGKLQGGGDVILSSRGDVTNNGLVGTTGGLTLNVAGTLVNTALMYAGTSMDVFADALHNLQGDILAGDQLRIQKNEEGQRNREVLNQSGTIGTLQGDLSINTAWLRNTRTGLKAGETVTEDLMSKYPWLTPLKADVPVDWDGIRVVFDIIECPMSLGMAWCNSDYSLGPFGNNTIKVPKPKSGFETLEFAVSTSSLAVTADGGAALISAGGNATVSVDTLDNEASNILASGSMTLAGSTLNNRSWFPEKVTRYVTYDFDNAYNSVELRYNARSGYREEVTQGTPLRAVIQAGSALNAHFARQVNNGAMDPNTVQSDSGLRAQVLNLPGQVNIDSGQQLLVPGQAETFSVGSPEWKDQLQSALVQIQGGAEPAALSGSTQPGGSGPDALSGQTAGKPAVDTHAYPLPSGDNGFFVISADPQSPYLITVNPDLDGLGVLDPQRFSDLYTLLGTQPGDVPRETRTTFTDENQFLGLSYLLDRLGLAPEKDYRFLGDAAFDTRYVSNALLNQAGSRYINGIGSDLAQMQYLMDSAARQQKALGLTFGVSLTADQISRLTGSILWYETVVINGQRVLVPRLYLSPDDVTVRNGSVIAGNNVVLSSGYVANSGSSVSAATSLSVTAAGTLSNSGNAVLETGEKLDLLAGNDILNVSSEIAGKTVTLETINGSISNLTQSEQTTWRGQKDTLSWTEVDSPALIRADESLSLRAGKDILMTGSELSSGSDMTLSASGNVRVSALETRSHSDAFDDRQDLTTRTAETRDTARQTESSLTSGGNIILSAGQDLAVAASSVVASDGIALVAGRDLSITTATESDYSHKEKKVTGGGFLGNSSTRTVTESGSTREKGSLISGETVVVQAGNNLLVKGSDVVGDGDVSLHGGNNVDILAATNSDTAWRFKETRKSGLMGSGGIGFTLGSSKTTHDLREQGTTQSQSFSTVGSTGGSVSVSAGNQTHISGADLIAGKNLSLSGDSVVIDPGHDKRTRDEKFEQKSSGLTVALSGAVGGAVNSTVSAAKEAKNESDDRLAALKTTKALLSGYQANQGMDLDAAKGASDKNNNNTVGISASLTRQHNKSEQHQESDAVAGSTLNAGNDLAVIATGEKGSINSGDILIGGSQLKAGGDTLLSAQNDILLSGAANTQKTTGSNSSNGGGVGIGIGVGSGGWGLTIFANGNSAHGNEKGDGTEWAETTVDSGGTATLSSGRDTTLTGAQVSGEKIVADVGRNLWLSSLQDSDDYDSRQGSVAAGGSFTFGSMTGSGYINASQDKMKSRYDSVQEQTGLYAGHGGYDVTVGNHTQLDGAVIASTATADKNSLDTGTLGFSDIHNEADYKVTHAGVSASAGGDFGGKNFSGNMGSGMVSALNQRGHAEGTTQAAISEGAIIVRDGHRQQQDIATLSRDAEHANDSISPIFDKEKEQKRLQTVQLIQDIAVQVQDIAKTQGEINALKAGKAELAKDGHAEPGADAPAEEKARYQQRLHDADSYKNALKQYGTGSAVQRAIQGVTAGLIGLAGGNIAGALAGASAPELAYFIGHKMGLNEDDVAAKALAHAILGGVVASLQGNSAAAGAAGGASGELVATAIASALYPEQKPSELSEEQKQTVTAVASVSAGIAGGLVADGTSGAAAGAQAGKNAVENNLLGTEIDQTKAAQAHGADVLSCNDAPGGEACKRGEAVNKAYAGALATGSVALLPGGAQAMWGLGAGANAGISYLADGTIDPTSAVVAGWTNVITMGSGFWSSVGWNAAGGALANQINGDDPVSGAITNGIGAGFGYGIGNGLKWGVNAGANWLKGGWDPKFNADLRQFTEVKGDYGVSKEMTPSSIPSSFGDIGGSITSEAGGKYTEYKMKQGGDNK